MLNPADAQIRDLARDVNPALVNAKPAAFMLIVTGLGDRWLNRGIRVSDCMSMNTLR